MKFSKFGVLFAAAFIVAGAFADAANVLISFSTKADYYADGTPVLDGEWYALCWAKDSNFDGMNLDCTPVNPAEKVLILAPLAKDGRCPHVLFQIDSKKAPSGGSYFVYVLDTRNAEGTAVATAATDADGKKVPATSLNGSVVSQGYTATAAAGKNSGKKKKGTAVAGAWAESAIADATQPKITAFKVEDARVKIKVSGMMPGVKYNIFMGETPSTLTKYGLDVPQTVEEGDESTFDLEPGDAKFFKVVRQPLIKQAE